MKLIAFKQIYVILILPYPGCLSFWTNLDIKNVSLFHFPQSLAHILFTELVVEHINASNRVVICWFKSVPTLTMNLVNLVLASTLMLTLALILLFSMFLALIVILVFVLTLTLTLTLILVLILILILMIIFLLIFFWLWRWLWCWCWCWIGKQET